MARNRSLNRGHKAREIGTALARERIAVKRSNQIRTLRAFKAMMRETRLVRD